MTIAFLLGAATTSPALAADLPAGFVRLSDIAPTVKQDMLYAGANNFLGRPAAKYEKPACILTTKAAEALRQIQTELEKQKRSLVVFDCYRPSSAVADFVSWVKQGGPTDAKWFPKTPRSALIQQGYIGARSAHSRGSTVDLAIVDTSPAASAFPMNCGHAGQAMLDYGGGFDCFDPVSRVAATVSPEAAQNRRELIAAMSKAGFRSYSGEWWHFTLRSEPFPKRSFDFPVR